MTRPRSKTRNAFGRWIDSTGLTYGELAAKLGCSKQRICHLRNGLGKPSLQLAAKIASMSAGDVPESTWTRRAR